MTVFARLQIANRMLEGSVTIIRQAEVWPVVRPKIA
jgi:hypothetical protein